MIRIAIGIVIVVAALLIFCGFQSRTASVDITCDDFINQDGTVTKEVELNHWADLLVVNLCSDPTTGFEWQLTEVFYNPTWTPFGGKFEAPEWTPIDHEFEPPEDTGLVGAPGKEVWTFPAGTGNITMEYSRPWEGGEEAERTLLLTVAYK
jgi:predicted secreted protein